jgi:hypothetical protein
MSETRSLPELLTVQEVATSLRESKVSVYRKIRRGDLPACEGEAVARRLRDRDDRAERVGISEPHRARRVPREPQHDDRPMTAQHKTTINAPNPLTRTRSGPFDSLAALKFPRWVQLKLLPSAGFVEAARMEHRTPVVLRGGSGMSVDVDREGRLGWFGYLDWGAILASVFAGLGVTLLLVAFGSAAGIEAADDGGDETRISSIVGTWTVVSALLGTLVGTFIGGRYSRFQSGASAVYNALVSWGFVQVLALWLAGSGIAGLLSGGLRSVQQAPTADAAEGTANEVADAVSWGGWALALGMALTLAAAIAGWWIGSRSQLADAETEDVNVRVR